MRGGRKDQRQADRLRIADQRRTLTVEEFERVSLEAAAAVPQVVREMKEKPGMREWLEQQEAKRDSECEISLKPPPKKQKRRR